jgi:hypothetical protein
MSCFSFPFKIGEENHLHSLIEKLAINEIIRFLANLAMRRIDSKQTQVIIDGYP